MARIVAAAKNVFIIAAHLANAHYTIFLLKIPGLNIALIMNGRRNYGQSKVYVPSLYGTVKGTRKNKKGQSYKR